MESFRFKTKRNEIFQSYSSLNKKFTQSIQTYNENQLSYRPLFKQNTPFDPKQNIIPSSQNPHGLFSTFVKPKKNLHKYSKSTHETPPLQKIKDSLTCRPTHFKKKILLTQNDKSEEFGNLNQKVKKIELMMRLKKQNFEESLRHSHSKLNSSYKNSLEDTVKFDMAKSSQLRLSESQSMDIKMETKSRKNIVFKGESKLMENIHKEKYEVQDFFVKENNIFNIVTQSRKCMDGIFPMFRNGATLCCLSSSLYLFGGVNSKLANSYHFNEYLPNEKQWISVKYQQSTPIMIPSFHSVETYKNSLIFIGGSCLSSSQAKKAFNPDIIVFDTDKEEFSKIKWNMSIRSHASTIYSNMLVIYGGIDERGRYSNTLYFLPLNTTNISQTNPHPYNLGSHNLGIAYHKIVNTFDVDGNLKSKLQMNGIICYGGKFQDGSLNEDIMLFRFNRNSQQTKSQRIIKNWQVVQTHGTKPEPRFNHSMNILHKKCICFIIGGMNIDGQALKDAWILDLTNSTWIEAVFDKSYEVLQRGIFSHATTVMNGEIYVFGGFNGVNKLTNEFWSADFVFNRANKKQEQIKKSRHMIPSTNKMIKHSSKTKLKHA